VGAHRRRLRHVGPLVLLALACFAGSCTSSSSSSEGPGSATSSASPSTSSSGGPVTLRFAVYGDASRVAAYDALAKAFTARHPEVTVHVQSASDAATAADRLERQLDEGTGPDVFLAEHDAVPELVAEGRVQPVDELLEQRGLLFGDNFERLSLESMAADSALQCMPNDVSPYVVFYNRRLLPGAARDRPPPGEAYAPDEGWNWARFAATARQMSRGDVKGVYLPPRLTTLIPLVRSAGSDLVDNERHPTTLRFADEANRQPLRTVLALVRDPAVAPSPAMLERQDAVTRFENGRLGMLVGTRALVPELREHPQLRFDVLPLPRLRMAQTVADISGYCINKASTHIGPAADFIAFASQDEGAAILARSGGVVPSNLAVLHSAAFEQPGRDPEHAQMFAAVIAHADPLPFSAEWSQVVAQTQPYVDRMFYAPVLDLDSLLPRVDELSATLLAEPSASPSPSPSP
jgi:multiple sugar transport system substrate-binding protein